MRGQPALIPSPKAKAGGSVYQSVSAQFRALFPKDDAELQDRKEKLRGWIGLALDHARAIDASPTATVGRAQVSAELRETLGYIADALDTGDGFDAFLAELNPAAR